MTKRRLWMAAILLAVVGCQPPLQNFDRPGDSERSLTLCWAPVEGSARTLIPSYPMPVSYDVLLRPEGGGSDVAQNGLTATSVSICGLAPEAYAITVTGRDSAGKAVVIGSGSVDLAAAATGNLNITLGYVGTGDGNGQIHLTFDTSSCGVAVNVTSFTLVDTSGAILVNGANLAGAAPTFTYSNSAAPVGSYKMFARFGDGSKVAIKADTILVVQNVDTAVTVALTAADFTAAYVPVNSLSLNEDTLGLTFGGTGSLVATLNPANASNTLTIWSSSAPAVVTVAQNGALAAMQVGTATITARAADNDSVSDTCTVTVRGRVTYYANGATSGSVPTDGNTYALGDTVTVQGNLGVLTRAGWSWNGWSTDPAATSGVTTATMSASGLSLYVAWKEETYPQGTFSIPVSGGTLEFDVAAGGNITITSVKDAGGVNNLANIDIPASIHGNPVTSLAENTFGGAGVTGRTTPVSVRIPEGVTSVEKSVLEGCSGLTTLDLPASLTSLGVSVCCNCTSLVSVSIPAAVKDIPNGGFWGASKLTSVTLKEGLETIGSRSFAETAVTTVNLPSTVVRIDDYAFSSCSALTTVNVYATVPPTVTASLPFDSDNKLTSIYVPSAKVAAYKTAWPTYEAIIKAGTW